MKTKHFLIAAMGKTIVIFTAFLLLLACEKTDEPDAPPGSDPNGTWTFGTQTWSAPLRLAAGCASVHVLPHILNAPPQYVDLTSGTGYYYNWNCVKNNASALCPPPWRVPTTADFARLLTYLSCDELSEKWGYNGFMGSDKEVIFMEFSSLWAITDGYRLRWQFKWSGHCECSVTYWGGRGGPNTGHQVRCVKD
jgi:hypothetical protein